MYLIKASMNRNIFNVLNKCYSVKTSITNEYLSESNQDNFEPVFNLPFIKNISLFHRTKVYQMIASALAISGCGALELSNILGSHSTLVATYIGLTGTAVLCLGSIPTTNTIGFLYISNDLKKVKISSVDFWGRRIDKLVNTDDWIPISELPAKKTDFLYLTPQLTDGTRYKLFLRYGKVLNPQKMGKVLD